MTETGRSERRGFNVEIVLPNELLTSTPHHDASHRLASSHQSHRAGVPEPRRVTVAVTASGRVRPRQGSGQDLLVLERGEVRRTDNVESARRACKASRTAAQLQLLVIDRR